MWNYHKKNYEADVSSIRTSSERIDCGFCGVYIGNRGAMPSLENGDVSTWTYFLNEKSSVIQIRFWMLRWKVFVQGFYSSISVFSWCRERQQTMMSRVQWCGRFKWRATGFEAFLSVFVSTMRWFSRKRSATNQNPSFRSDEGLILVMLAS